MKLTSDNHLSVTVCRQKPHAVLDAVLDSHHPVDAVPDRDGPATAFGRDGGEGGLRNSGQIFRFLHPTAEQAEYRMAIQSSSEKCSEFGKIFGTLFGSVRGPDSINLQKSSQKSFTKPSPIPNTVLH